MSKQTGGGRVDLIAVPYDSARRGERMGAGPEAFMPRLADRLGATGYQVRSVTLELALDPASDPEHRALDAAVSLGVALVDRASRSP